MLNSTERARGCNARCGKAVLLFMCTVFGVFMFFQSPHPVPSQKASIPQIEHLFAGQLVDWVSILTCRVRIDHVSVSSDSVSIHSITESCSNSAHDTFDRNGMGLVTHRNKTCGWTLFGISETSFLVIKAQGTKRILLFVVCCAKTFNSHLFLIES